MPAKAPLQTSPEKPTLSPRMRNKADDPYLDESLSAWRAVVEDLAQGRTAVSWTALENIARVLTEAAKRAPHTHTFFAEGGALKLTGASPSHEPHCLELHFDGTTHIVRPASLQLVVPEREPLREWAYFRLETAELAPSGARQPTCWGHGATAVGLPGQKVALARDSLAVCATEEKHLPSTLKGVPLNSKPCARATLEWMRPR